ncbi:MAG: hypothetical protein P4L50_08265 [Anaerolineaceae bacterium]|nr:hypothetical protein [Anaerolineaceae bacterium]
MSDNPIFYLTSAESSPTLIPRKCWIIERLLSEERGDIFLRLHIEPAINVLVPIDTKTTHREEINEVVIAAHYKDDSLDLLGKLFISVYICRIVNYQIRNTGRVSSKDLFILLIGEIYSTLSDAEYAIRNEKWRN